MKLNKARLKKLEGATLSLAVSAALIGVSISPTTLMAKTIEFDVPLNVNKGLSGEVSATIINTSRGGENITEVRVSVQRLKQLFKKYANEEQLEAWFGKENEPSSASGGSSSEVVVSAVKTDETSTSVGAGIASKTTSISLLELRKRGLDINFDSALLSISALIPRLGTQSISLRGRRLPVPEDGFRQSSFSTGVNFRARNTFNHQPNGVGQRGFGPTSVAVDGFASIGGFDGWSLYYSADYLEDNDKPWSRRDVTLIHDNYDTGVRYSLGDFTPRSNGFQSSPSMLGINIERRYGQINPFRNIRPTGRSQFTLDRASRVSFEVNGIIVETRELEPGDYSVADFPLSFGANNVRVFVDDGTSNIEVANFSAFSNLNLLSPGLSNFGISAGVQRDPSGGRNRRYEDEPVVLGFYERGVNQNLTLGAQVEVTENRALIGSTAVYGTRYGLFSLEAATSQREGFDNGYSSILGYSHEGDLNAKWGFRTDLQFDYQSVDFGGINSDGNTNERKGVRAAVGLNSRGYAFSVNGTLIDNNDVETKLFTTRLAKSFGRFDLSLDYRYSKTQGDLSSDNITFSIATRFGGSSVQGQYQSISDQYRLGWSGKSRLDAGDASINQAILVADDNVRSAQFNGGYISPRFVTDFDHLESESISDIGNDSSATTLRAATAIGYADGKVAFGRPFNEGFVIVDPHSNLRGKKVTVTRGSTAGNRITSTKRLGTTLVPISGSYRQQRLSFIVDDLPLGYDVGSGEVEIFPSFLSGYRYQIGSDAANTVIGKALWPDNTAPSLIVGKLVPHKGGEEITVFTNKTGRFVAERATAGKYQIVFNNGEHDFGAEIEVKADGDEPGLVQVGTIVLEKLK